MKHEIEITNSEFFAFDASDDEIHKTIYFSTKEKLIDHIKWWLYNRTDGFYVTQLRFEK